MFGKDRRPSEKVLGTMRWYSLYATISLFALVCVAACVLVGLFLLMGAFGKYNSDLAAYGYSSLAGHTIFIYDMVLIGLAVLAALVAAPYFLLRGAYAKALKDFASGDAAERQLVTDDLIHKIESGKYGHNGMYLRFLADCGDDRKLDFLIGLLCNKNSSVKVHAIKALATLGDYRAVAPIKALQGDRDMSVSKAAGLAVDALTQSREEPASSPESQEEDSKPSGKPFIDTANYTTIPYTSFSAAIRLMEQRGKPTQAIVRKADYNDHLDIVLTYEDGGGAIFGGFALNSGHKDTRANLLKELLKSAGFVEEDDELSKMKLPAKFSK